MDAVSSTGTPINFEQTAGCHLPGHITLRVILCFISLTQFIIIIIIIIIVVGYIL
jgi:hypothetical protein